MKIKLKELDFPSKTSMEFFQALLSNEQLFELIKHFSLKDKKERIIEMPSNHILKKAICFFYGQKVMAGEMTWEQVIKEFKKGLTFKEIGLHQAREIKRLYHQRRKEILEESK